MSSNFRSFLAAAFSVAILLLAGQAARAADIIAECNTADGQAILKYNGKQVKINCGPTTPSVCGRLPKQEPCLGTAFPCMKGKKCITISGGIKFHMTNCGSGGPPAPSGIYHGAGCIEVANEDMDALETKEMEGKSFCVHGKGGTAQPGGKGDAGEKALGHIHAVDMKGPNAEDVKKMYTEAPAAPAGGAAATPAAPAAPASR